jgi:glutamyl-tRNA reductase
MSESCATRALRDRFETIRQAEIERLTKKFRGLSDDERRSVEAITKDVIQALVRVPERVLAAESSEPAARALVRLFGL